MTVLAGMKYSSVDDVAVVDDMVADDNWVMQQKMDGTRAIVRITERSIDFYGANGHPLKHTAAMQHFDTIRASLDFLREEAMGGHLTLDGELMIRTGEYRVFDFVAPALNQQTRYSLLTPYLAPAGSAVSVVVQWESSADKRTMLTRLYDEGVEGVVFKRRDGLYLHGIRSNEVVKYKFIQTADVVVLSSSRSRNEAGREVGAFVFAIPDDEGELIPLGACSAIGKPHVEVGDVIEVAYLYRDNTGGLVQPRMTRVRKDKMPWECSDDQFRAYTREEVK